MLLRLLQTCPVVATLAFATASFGSTACCTSFALALPHKLPQGGDAGLDGLLDELADESEKEAAKKTEGEYADLVQRMQDVLGDKVKEVRVSQRLTDSPSCLVTDEQDMAVHRQRLLKQAGQPCLPLDLFVHFPLCFST